MLYHHLSIEIFWVSVSLLESCLAALEHLLTQCHTVLRLAWVVLKASHEGFVLWRTLFLDNEHARSCLVVAGKPEWRDKYSIPLFSRRVLRFLAVENMYDLDYILLLINLNNQATMLMALIENAVGKLGETRDIVCCYFVGLIGVFVVFIGFRNRFQLSAIKSFIIMMTCCQSLRIYCIVLYQCYL